MPIYYSIQSASAWEEAQHKGYLTGEGQYVDPFFLDAYHWMMQQMAKRLEAYQGEYPIWLWPQRPDLRNSALLERGQKGVLLDIELPEHQVLLSDFQSWHLVLAKQPITAFEQEIVDMEKSWERIFDFDFLNAAPDWGSVELQGVCAKVSLSQVRRIKTFQAR